MGESLNPTVLDRISRALHPDFARTLLARRIVAAVLVLLAGIAAWRPDPHAAPRDVVVADRDLAPGVALTAADVALRVRPAGTLPEGAVTTLDAVLGATLAGPVRRGEVLTDARVLGSRLAGLNAGPDARTVPVHLADPAVSDLVRSGDVVDVVGAPASDDATRPRLLATGAVVVLVSPAAAGDGKVVLLALPVTAAHTLAGATLVQDVTLTIH
ncbi:MAG: flagellar biosynthesis protein FlgA [Mycobacterium sp.]|nr:flagellar biosynthesis protein FlgA [Mycobacterium sp.]